MSLIIRDRVQELFVGNGVSSFGLTGAVANYRTFGSVMTTGDTTRYCAVDDTASTPAWEVGVGTYNATGNSLSRSVVASSNGNALVSFAANSNKVFITIDSAYFLTVVPSIVTALIYG